MKEATAMTFKTKMAVTVAMLLWASAYVGIRAGLVGYSPGALALLRFMICSVCMLIFYLRLPTDRNKISTYDKVRLLVLGVIGLGVYHYSLNYGEISVTSGTASFIISQSPVITTILAVLFLNERLNWVGIIGMAISILGVTVIMLEQDTNFKFNMGNLFVLIAAISGSCYSVLQKPFLKKLHPVEVTAYLMWGGTIGLLVFTPSLSHEIFHAPLNASLAVVYLGIFPAAVAYLAWSYVLAVMPASRATNFLYFTPLLSTLLGWLYLNEVPTWMSLIGGVIALIGVWVLNESYRFNASKKDLAAEASS